MSIKKTAIIGDIHLPYEDKEAVELVLCAIDNTDVDRIVINGDLADFYNVNMHGPKHPEIVETLEDELNYVRDWLKRLRERFRDIEIVYIFGNHSDRLSRFILKNAKPFWNIVTPEKYFMLDDLNIKWIPYNQKYRIDNCNLYVQHSPPSYGKNGAMTSLERKLDSSYIYGCTHRAQVAHRTSSNGEVYSCYFNGWLGDQDNSVFSYTKGHDSWQKTMCMVTVVDGVDFSVELSIIKNNIITIEGKTFKG